MGTQVFFCGRIDHIQNAAPFFCLIVSYRFAAVSIEKTDELIAVNPDFTVSFLLRFVENKLNAEMQVRRVDIVGVFFCAVSGPTHVSDDITGGDDTALLQI